MKFLLKCVKKSLPLLKLLKRSIPSLIDNSEELVRRCRKKNIRNNGGIHKSSFYFGYHELSVDRSKYRSYKKTLQDIPKNENIDDWRLIQGITQYIKPIKGVEELKANPVKNNPAHALIVCDSRKEKRNEIAESLSKVFTNIPKTKYKI